MYNRKLIIPLPVAVVIFVVILLIVLGYFSASLTDKTFFENEGPMWLFVVGLVPGLAVALLQFLLSWAEFSQIAKFHKMKIKNVLDSRDAEEYYSRLLLAAETRIDVQGETASRFVRDFADAQSPREDKKSLITALKRGVKVRFLLPEKAFLKPRRHSDFDQTQRKLQDLRVSFPGNLEVKYFSGIPVTSLVRVDDDIVAGPVLPDVQSQHTPAIHTVVGSRFGQTYLENLESLWANSRTM